MSSATEQWEQLLTPAVMQEKLISASLYVTAFELLKESIIGRIRSFYMVGFDAGGDVIDEKYETVVLSRNKNPLLASLDWLSVNNVVDENDRQAFERIRTTRNLLAHELPAMVMGGKDFHHVERFQELIALLKKIEVWWVVNMEIPVNPDFDGKEIDEEGIVPGPVLMLQMMLEVLSGNEELLKHYRANSNVAAGL
ncbi:hypothetical protein [Rhodoferax ferrireducens]|uniref:hypothetical protein n=1 Tax=Rhodoferax ferrireducens TaxID=192843 RepID=UPI003BB77670